MESFGTTDIRYQIRTVLEKFISTELAVLFNLEGRVPRKQVELKPKRGFTQTNMYKCIMSR